MCNLHAQVDMQILFRLEKVPTHQTDISNLRVQFQVETELVAEGFD